MKVYKYIKIKLMLLAIVLMGFKVHAQKQLSLTQVLNLAKQNNLSLQINQKNEALAKQDYTKSNALFLPQISLNHTAIGTTNPLMAFGSKLNQEILTQQDFNPALLNDPDYIRNYTTKILVQQPLINADGYFERQAAKLNTAFTTQENIFKTKHIHLEVKKAYMQLQVALKQIEVLQKAQETAHANLRFASDHFKQGYLQKSDFLDVEIRVQDVENQLVSAKSNMLNASNYLSHLLNLSSSEIILPTDELKPDIHTLDSTYVLPEHRADIQAMSLGYKAQENLLKSSKMKFLPSLNLFGHVEIHDDKLLGADAKGYLIGAQLSWDVFKGGMHWSDVQKHKIELEKTTLNIEQYKQQSQLEINKTIRALFDANNKLKLSYKGVIQSKEALKIRTNRFKQGLEKTADLLMAESKYALKQLEYLNTIFNYNYTVAYLKLLVNQD